MNFSTVSAADLPSNVEGAEVFFDTEGTGIHKLNSIPTLGLFRVDGRNYAVPWDQSLASWITDQFPRAALVAAHNAKHDYHQCLNGGVSADSMYVTNWVCTMVTSVLCDGNRFSYSLDNLSSDLFGENKSKQLYAILADHFGGPATAKGQGGNIGKINTHVPSPLLSSLVEYGFQDIVLTEKLHRHWGSQIEQEDLGEVLSLECRAMRALAEMERRGAPVRVDRLDEARGALETEFERCHETAINLVGRRINPRSPKEMTYAFRVLGLPISYTKLGRASFNKDVLESLRPHPFVDALTNTRTVKTLLDTFINSAIAKQVTEAGLIHTNYNQVKTEDGGASTGRLSSSDPNLQQVPKRNGELASIVRGLFGHKEKDWICGDWEQFEFRVFGHYANDPRLIQTYKENPSADFHQSVADLTSVVRDRAKRINLGLVFGMGEGKLAKELKLPFTESTNPRTGKTYFTAGEEAKALFATYHNKFPGARRVLIKAENLARRRGYVRTISGRRIRFPDGGEHKAGGLVFQGTSADVMKQKLVECNDRFRKTDVDFVLVVHDEFDFLAPKEVIQETRAEVKRILEDVPSISIPILSDVKSGRSWWDASK